MAALATCAVTAALLKGPLVLGPPVCPA